MITLAITSQKGGVGKTTLGINLAHAFARSGRNTVLVDSDPQGSVGLSLTRDSRHLSGFFDVLADPSTDVSEIVVPTRMETLSLVPAGHSSAYDLGGSTMGVTLHRVRRFLRKIEAMGFDVCLMDTAAGIFGATADVLAVSDGVIVPQQAEPLGVRSVPKMLEALARMRVANPRLQVLGVALTMVQNDLDESRESGEALRGLLPPEMVFESEIPRSDLFIKASARGLPVGVMEEGAETLEIFDQLRVEIEERIFAASEPD